MQDIFELNLAKENLQYKMYLPNKETNLIENIIFRTGKPYEYEMLSDMATWLKRINPDKSQTVLDVGMNIGNHAMFFAALRYKVIGIEANPKMCAIAKKA